MSTDYYTGVYLDRVVTGFGGSTGISLSNFSNKTVTYDISTVNNILYGDDGQRLEDQNANGATTLFVTTDTTFDSVTDQLSIELAPASVGQFFLCHKPFNNFLGTFETGIETCDLIISSDSTAGDSDENIEIEVTGQRVGISNVDIPDKPYEFYARKSYNKNDGFRLDFNWSVLAGNYFMVDFELQIANNSDFNDPTSHIIDVPQKDGIYLKCFPYGETFSFSLINVNKAQTNIYARLRARNENSPPADQENINWIYPKVFSIKENVEIDIDVYQSNIPSPGGNLNFEAEYLEIDYTLSNEEVFNVDLMKLMHDVNGSYDFSNYTGVVFNFNATQDGVNLISSEDPNEAAIFFEEPENQEDIEELTLTTNTNNEFHVVLNFNSSYPIGVCGYIGGSDAIDSGDSDVNNGGPVFGFDKSVGVKTSDGEEVKFFIEKGLDTFFHAGLRVVGKGQLVKDGEETYNYRGLTRNGIKSLLLQNSVDDRYEYEVQDRYRFYSSSVIPFGEPKNFNDDTEKKQKFINNFLLWELITQRDEFPLWLKNEFEELPVQTEAERVLHLKRKEYFKLDESEADSSKNGSILKEYQNGIPNVYLRFAGEGQANQNRLNDRSFELRFRSDTITDNAGTKTTFWQGEQDRHQFQKTSGSNLIVRESYGRKFYELPMQSKIVVKDTHRDPNVGIYPILASRGGLRPSCTTFVFALAKENLVENSLFKTYRHLFDKCSSIHKFMTKPNQDNYSEIPANLIDTAEKQINIIMGPNDGHTPRDNQRNYWESGLDVYNFYYDESQRQFKACFVGSAMNAFPFVMPNSSRYAYSAREGAYNIASGGFFSIVPYPRSWFKYHNKIKQHPDLWANRWESRNGGNVNQRSRKERYTHNYFFNHNLAKLPNLDPQLNNDSMLVNKGFGQNINLKSFSLFFVQMHTDITDDFSFLTRNPNIWYDGSRNAGRLDGGHVLKNRTFINNIKTFEGDLVVQTDRNDQESFIEIANRNDDSEVKMYLFDYMYKSYETSEQKDRDSKNILRSLAKYYKPLLLKSNGPFQISDASAALGFTAPISHPFVNIQENIINSNS